MINLEKFKHQSWLDGRIIAINGDCQEVMAEIKDKEIDLCLTDPPYSIGYDKDIQNTCGKITSKNAKAKWTSYHKTNWDKEPSKEIFGEIFRISQNQIIWGGEHLCLNFPKSRGWIVWDKNNDGTMMADCELAWTSFDKPVRKFKFTWRGMLQGDMKNKDDRIHPTQKSSRLMQWCLNNHSKENDLIFDAFSGSFTTAISCIRTKRRFIGCELDPIYFEKACERIDTELKQLTLF